MPPDPKPAARVEDPALLRALHARWGVCALCYWSGTALFGVPRLSLHHVHRHPRDDVEANLVMLCGDGTTGHHGLVEANDPDACRHLSRYIRAMRADTFLYLTEKLGGAIAADAWLTRLATVKQERRA